MGVFLLPLLAALPWRQAFRSGGSALAVAAVIWLPFVLADAGTIDAGLATAGVSVYPGSGPHLLGIETWTAAPDWLRPVQTAVALALAALAVVRGRWAAALLLAVGARLALDPAVIPYYTAALIFAALIWDLFSGRRPLPIWGLATVLAFYAVPALISAPRAEGLARVAVVIAAAVIVLGAPKGWYRRLTPPAVT